MRQIFEKAAQQDAAVIGKITFLLGDAQVLEQMRNQPAREPFDGETLRLLARLAEVIRKDRSIVGMPDVMTFAFWCRRAHLAQLKSAYAPEADAHDGDGKARETDGIRELSEISSFQKRLGRGVSLHFAPSNIPVLFAFTMAAGLLAGNCVIVRLPQKQTEEADAVIAALQSLLETEFRQFRDRILLCRYAHDADVTAYLSSLCDVRLIWGSDASVREIRSIPLRPRAVEIPFASRGSAAVFGAGAMIRAEDPMQVARAFYNDTYLNDQNACSSPRMIFWVGERQEIETARARFWKQMELLLEEKPYEVAAALAVKKTDAALLFAAAFSDEISGIQITAQTNRLVRVWTPKLSGQMWDYTAPGGFFIESGGIAPEQMRGILGEYCQTLCTFGVDRIQLAEQIWQMRAAGVDRVVEVGHALDFSLTWDGVDLIEAMSRRIDLGRL